ncbi:MAG: hypothetical protein V3U93_00015 [Alphaproteobacteria bacterium]
MPKKAAPKIAESKLTKGQLRKLNAVRKSFGKEIADKAFVEWLAEQPTEKAIPGDRNAKLMVKTLEPLVLGNKLKIPRGGYLVRRGRGRIIVEQVRSE